MRYDGLAHKIFLANLRVAQRSERRSYKPGVEGPTPSPRTKIGPISDDKNLIGGVVQRFRLSEQKSHICLGSSDG